MLRGLSALCQNPTACSTATKLTCCSCWTQWWNDKVQKRKFPWIIFLYSYILKNNCPIIESHCKFGFHKKVLNFLFNTDVLIKKYSTKRKKLYISQCLWTNPLWGVLFVRPVCAVNLPYVGEKRIKLSFTDEMMGNA